MTQPQPTDGYASRAAAWEAMKDDGATDKVIAKAFGVSPGTVSASVSRLRARRKKRDMQFRVILDGNVYMDLAREAGRRRMHPERLIDNLLLNIIKKNLFNTVLGTDI